MKTWTPLTPSRPGDSLSSLLKGTSLSSTGGHGQPIKLPPPTLGAWIGGLPESIHLVIIGFLPVPELPRLAKVSRAFGRLVASDEAWETRCRSLGLIAKEDAKAPTISPTSPSRPLAAPGFRDLSSSTQPTSNSPISTPPSAHVSSYASGSISSQPRPADDPDGFGDFVDVPMPAASSSGVKPLLDFGDFVPVPSRTAGGGGRTNGFFAFAPLPTASVPCSAPPAPKPKPKPPYRKMYQAHHLLLIPLLAPILTVPSPPLSQILSLLFPPHTSPSTQHQADQLVQLLSFLSPAVQPISSWRETRNLVLAAADRFDAACLVGFEGADERADEDSMTEWAKAGWKVWIEAGHYGKRRRPEEWEVGRVWIERREIFYEGGGIWDPLKNIVTPPEVQVAQLNFTPMDGFITHVLGSISSSGALASRVFPQSAQVLRMFAERVVSDVIGEGYVQPLLQRVREVGGGGGASDLFLRASAAVFAVAGRVVDVVVEAGKDEATGKSVVGRPEVEDLVFKMFEFNMDEYLDEEIDWVKDAMAKICKEWDQRLKNDSSKAAGGATPTSTTFLTSQNPALVKRNVLASFRDVLLLPVTIIPKTAVYVVSAGSRGAVNGLSMLNPQNWQPTVVATKGQPAGFAKGTGEAMVFELGDDEDPDATPTPTDKQFPTRLAIPNSTNPPIPPAARLAVAGAHASSSASSTPFGSRPVTPAPPPPATFESLQLLISLDVALELIHADREALKRVETFQAYPGRTGARVKETIEEVFIMLLQAMSDRHIAPGFRLATEQMRTYKPAEHEEATSVAPLLQFFELVHVGDTIQSMVQVYFDKEMAPHIDRTDFLNGVVREKKRFENVLDEAVAAGLNAGIEVLMNQVEHIIITRTGPREYYPMEGAELDLGPTKGCREAVASLEMHCNLLKGSTSKDVLEVFYQEVGIRLQNILQRHLKRQIISLTGGFQIISDLNTYHAFVSSLKQARVTEDFASLKMLGHVYIVEDAKDLAQIVRDVTRYGGTYRPEDIYEFIQRRSDWKRIEKTVDSAMYSLSIKEDCVIC